MVGLEEGDEASTLAFLYFAEADKGVHLVRVAAHFLGELFQPVDQRVGAVLQRPAVGLELPQHGVEQGEALRVRMADGGPGQVDERLGDGEHRRAASRGHRPLAAEQLAILPAHLPDDAHWRHAGHDQFARRVAPAVEIVRLIKGDLQRVDLWPIGQQHARPTAGPVP